MNANASEVGKGKKAALLAQVLACGVDLDCASDLDCAPNLVGAALV